MANSSLKQKIEEIMIGTDPKAIEELLDLFNEEMLELIGVEELHLKYDSSENKMWVRGVNAEKDRLRGLLKEMRGEKLKGKE